MIARAFALSALTLTGLPFSALPALAQDATSKTHDILVAGLDHARLSLICAEGDAARQEEIKAIWKDAVMEILMALDEAEVKPKVLPAIAASRDGGTLALRDGEDAAEWQARCAAETSWQGDAALKALKSLPSQVKDAL